MSCPPCPAHCSLDGNLENVGPDSGPASAPKPEPFNEDLYEWEIRDSSTPFWQHAMAGSCAGIAEHVCMYPIDTIKTRIQISKTPLSAVDALRATWAEGGMGRLMRGSLVIGAGCIPAHIAFFGTYEFAKSSLLDSQGEEHQPLRAAACGAIATVAHDAIITPTDVVKQRLQVGGYSGALDCVQSTLRYEGAHAFYRSLPTTLMMSIPYMGVFAAMNESLKKLLNIGDAGNSSLSGAPWYFFVAGLSGVVASSLTLPLDNVKTRLQTQGGQAPGDMAKYDGIVSTMRIMAREEGAAGFFRGLGPRATLAMPSAAICWGTYESIRMVLAGWGEARGEASEESAAAVAVDGFDWEEWDRKTPFWKHAVAGSCAGMMEHVAMYPVDTVKTRMQAAPVELGSKPMGATQVVREVLREHGFSGLMRGCMAIGVGCIPAHIALFCTYEFTKARLMTTDKAEHQPLRAAMCGASATVMHDMIITPTDVVKQRLQLGCYSGSFDCIRTMWRTEGLLGFYRSLPTTLISECPFHGVLVATNESLKILLGLEARGDSHGHGSVAGVPLGWHFFSTGVSGIIASVLTQPLDVVKTRQQTQNVGSLTGTGEVSIRYTDIVTTARIISREEGMAGFFRGTLPRLLFAAPSAAMCWGTYEVTKALLTA